MDYVMGIDLGSTSLKAIVYDRQGNAVASGCRPTMKFHPNPQHPEWTVWQPDQIWSGTADAIKEAVSKLDNPRAIRGVAVTGMGMDGVPVDEKGQWLYPFISWHDPRTAPQYQWWLDNVGDEKTFLTGGWPIWQISPALRILWMQEHEPEILARTDKWLLIEDFVNLMLTGCRATDYTMASCTGLFDQKTLDWSDELFKKSGISRQLFSDAHPSASFLGEVTPAASEATWLPIGTPVFLGGHDFLCGALPVGAFQAGKILDVTGTWEIVLTATDAPMLTPQVFQAGMVMEAHVAKGKFAAWGGAVAAEMVEWYRKEYGFEARHKANVDGCCTEWDLLIEEAASSPAGSHGLMFLPHMSGAGCPVKDGKSMGSFVGLRNIVSKGDMLRAIIEGLDYQFLDIIRTMQAAMDIKPERLVAVGGAVKNKFWMQNKADVVGLPIDVPGVEEATPLGAAILAGTGAGIWKDEQEAFECVNRPGEVYEPDQKLHQKYQELFQVYRQLYPALKDIHHQLHDISLS